jgi:transcriptional regulator with XRE-family HTH domain
LTVEPTPPTARRELGNLLRELRTQRNLSLEDVGAATSLNAGFLSRVERGLRELGDDKAERLAEFYSLPQRTRDRLRQLARLGRGKPWWERDPMTREMREYVGFEQAATAIMTYGSIVPGLLQTRAYCEAMLERTAFDTRDEEERRITVEHRLRRQELLDRDDPRWFWMILDESVLYRATGGHATHREQLAALHAATARPRVSVRILPFTAGAHPGMDSRFVILSTKGDHGPELVYVEGLSGARHLVKDEELARCLAARQALSALALSEDASRDVLAEAIRAELPAAAARRGKPTPS